jgi:hypothetical protein
MTTGTVVKVGEFEVRHDNGNHFTATRNGELWRELTGDNLVLALVDRIAELEKLWLEPTDEMLNTGIAEAQSQLQVLADSQFEVGNCDYAEHIDIENVNDSEASDLVVFCLQAMASKMPKPLTSASAPELEQLCEKYRIRIVPEYEGQWFADLFGDHESVQFTASGVTPLEATLKVVEMYQKQQ